MEEDIEEDGDGRDAEERPAEDEVAVRRDRQELGEPLDEAEEDGLGEIQRRETIRYPPGVIDRSTILSLVFLAALALSGWLWFQVTYQAQEEARVWLRVHQAEVNTPRWYRRPDIRDYVKPPAFDRFELVPDTVPRFYTPPAERVAQFRVRLSTERGERVWIMRLEDKGSFLFTDWKPVLFVPEERLRRHRGLAA